MALRFLALVGTIAALALPAQTQQPDGGWRIEGCYLQAPEEHQA